MAVNTTIQTLYAKRLIVGCENADEVVNEQPLTEVDERPRHDLCP